MKECIMLKITTLMAVLIIFTSLLSACSVVYDLQQNAALETCDKIVDWNERSACKAKNKTTFEQYEKQRKDILIKGTEK